VEVSVAQEISAGNALLHLKVKWRFLLPGTSEPRLDRRPKT